MVSIILDTYFCYAIQHLTHFSNMPLKTNYFLFYLFFACTIMATSCSNENMDIAPVEQQEAQQTIEEEIFNLVNKHRTSKGLPTLKVSNLANKLAKAHNQYMIDQRNISHDGFEQRANTLFMDEKAKNVGENVAAGQKTAKQVMDAWLQSEGHKKNMEGDFTHIGISAIKNKSGTYYFTQLFYKK